MSREKEILSQVSIYSSSTIVTQAITLVAAILCRRFLGPTQIGIWALLQVIQTYAALSALGVTNATTREIPFYLGKGDTRKSTSIKNAVFSFAACSSVVVSLGILVYVFTVRETIRTELFYGLLFVSGLNILQRINDLMITLLRAYKQFTIAGKQMIYSAIVNAILVATLSYRFEIYGFMWAMCLSFFFNIGYLMMRYRFHIRFDMNWTLIRGLIAYGFPLMILSMLGVIFLSIDKLMIVRYLSFEALGLYGVAILAANLIARFPSSVGTVLLPNFHEKYGETGNKQDLLKYLTKSTRAFTYSMPVVIALAWFFVPHVIKLVLPAFVDSIPALKILILSPYFLALANPCENLLIVIKKHGNLFPIVALTCALAVLFNLLAIKAGYGIVGVALATAIVFGIKFALTYFLAYRELSSGAQWGMKNFVSICAKFLWMIVILIGSTIVVPGGPHFGYALLRTLFFLVLYSPFLIKFNKEFEIWNTLVQKMRPKTTSSSLHASVEG